MPCEWFARAIAPKTGMDSRMTGFRSDMITTRQAAPGLGLGGVYGTVSNLKF